MVPDLVSLDLSHSNIKRVAAKAFSQLDSLEKLYINHNEIRELKRATVETFKGINMIDIYPYFHKTPTSIERKSTKLLYCALGLHGIELAHNPWNCDCKMRPLKEWLDAQNVPHEVDPTCQTPTRIERKSFSSLSLEEFACPPELLLAPRYIGATAGTSI